MFHFVHNFWRKTSCCYILMTDQIYLSGCFYFVRYWAIYVLVIICLPDCAVISFEINLAFLIEQFFLHDQKVKTRVEKSWERKELSRGIKKYFSSFLKSFHWSKSTKFFWKVTVRLQSHLLIISPNLYK